MTEKRPISDYFFELSISLLLGLLWLAFVYDNVNYIRHYGFKISAGLLVLKGSTDLFFVLIRRFPRETSTSPYGWIVAMLGSIMILFLRAADRVNDILIGQVIQCLGLLLQIFAMFSLNRSFGIVPANRGVKTNGMYRYLRHPVYGTYLLGQIGFLINNPTLPNVAVVALGTMFQIARIFEEEKFLMRDEAYRNYAARTRWRLIPFVF